MNAGTGVSYFRSTAIKTIEDNDSLDHFGVIRSARSYNGDSLVQYAMLTEHGFHDNIIECTWFNDIDNSKAAIARGMTDVLQSIDEGLAKADLVPIFALGIAIVLAVLHGTVVVDMGFSGSAILTCVEQGVLAGAIAVAGFDVVKGIVHKVQE